MQPLIFALTFMLLCGTATAQANYTKTAELQPLRTSFADLQEVLTKTRALVSAANSGAKILREELVIKSGVITVTLPGYNLVHTSARVPDKIDSLMYSFFASEPSKISRLSIDLADYKRSITVAGPSPEQVDAVFAVLREDLQAVSTPIGGSGLKIFLGLPAIWLLVTTGGWCLVSWRARRSPISLAIALSAVFLVVLLLVLPIDELLSGFWAVNGEPSFMIRYGPHMSFIGFLIAVVGIPFTVLQTLPKEKVKSASAVVPDERSHREDA